MKETCDRLKQYVVNHRDIYDKQYDILFIPENTTNLSVNVVGKGQTLTQARNLLGSTLLKIIGVCSFSLGGPNPVLLSQYSDHHRGVCLEYQAENLVLFQKILF